MIFYLLSTLTLALMAVVTPQLRQDFRLSESQLGLLTSAFMLAYGLVGIPAGVEATRWGGRVLAVSCACLVVGSGLFAASSSFPGFLASRVLQGLGAGMVVPVCSPVMARFLAPARRNRGWGIFASGKGLGALIGLLLMPTVAILGGFRAAFGTTAILAFAIGILVFSQKQVRAVPDCAAEDTSFRALGGNLAAVVCNREVLLLGLFNAASLAVGTGVLIWTPDFLQSRFGSSVGISAYLTAGMAVAQLIGAPSGAAVAARVGRMRVIFGAMALMTVMTVLVSVVPGRALVFVVVALVGLFSLAYFSPRFAMIPEVVAKPEHVGPATGLINALGFGISMLAPWLFGLALDYGLGYFVAYAALAAFGAAGALGVVLFRAPPSSTARSSSGRLRGVAD